MCKKNDKYEVWAHTANLSLHLVTFATDICVKNNHEYFKFGNNGLGRE